MEGSDVQTFLRAYNAVPPATDYEGDRILILRSRAHPSLLVAVFHEGCLQLAEMIPPQVFMRMMGGSA